MKPPRSSQLVCITFATIVLFAFRSFAATLYVDVNSTNPVAPYTNWATAANVIQDAVDAAGTNDTVLVTNGTYSTGGKVMAGDLWISPSPCRASMDRTSRSYRGRVQLAATRCGVHG